MDDLLGRSVPVCVAIKGRLGVDLIQQKPRLAPGHGDAHAVGVADNLVVLVVIFHQHVGRHAEADGFVLVEGVYKTRVTFAGAVDFVHPGNTEAGLEGLPDIWAQAIADHLLQGVVGIVRGEGLVHEIAAQLPHIDEGVAALLPHLPEEVAGGEAAAQHGACAGPQHRTEADDQPRGVV